MSAGATTLQHRGRMPARHWLIAQVPLFSRLPGKEVSDLAVLMHRRRYGKGEVVFHEGDIGTTLYIVEHGEAKIVLRSPDGKEAVLGYRGPGDFFGELALLDGEPRSADVVTTQPSVLLTLRREDFLRFLTERPEAAIGLLEMLSRRLRSTTRLFHDTTFLDVRARVVKALLDLTRSKGVPTPDGAITVRVTQGDIAGIVGATRESANKWLKYYERLGVLHLHRGRLVVRDPQRLRSEIY